MAARKAMRVKAPIVWWQASAASCIFARSLIVSMTLKLWIAGSGIVLFLSPKCLKDPHLVGGILEDFREGDGVKVALHCHQETGHDCRSGLGLGGCLDNLDWD